MECYYTCGQIAKKLRVSMSTLKRWVAEPELRLQELRNRSGWRLFSEQDFEQLLVYKRQMKKSGKRFTQGTLLPINGASHKPAVND